jgi:rhomboid family GlyGly-CTERM serine protease
LVAAGALVVFFWPTLAAALVFDRERVLAGEWWRIVTGHFVHFSPSHLAWNLAVIVPAGIWAERVAPTRTRVLFPLAAALIGGALLAFEPQLARYGGLSGIATGVVVLLAAVRLKQRATNPWFWRGVLALIALKIVAEIGFASQLFARFANPDVRSVPLSHIAGAAAGLLALSLPRPRLAR